MRCADVRPLLAAYLQDALGDGERRPVEAHLEGCRACAAELAGLVRTERQVARGLQAWAAAGTPAVDLAAGLEQRLADVPARVAGRPRRRRLWPSLAAAAAAVLALILTFPRWAGAASEWPVVGPWIQEVILSNAGLRWAYEHDLIAGTLARDAHDGIELKVLGVLADPAQTSVIYEVTGLPPDPSDGEQAEPVRAHDGLFWSPPPRTGHPGVFIPRVNGQGTASSTPMAVRTPLGLVGTTFTYPLETEEAVLTVSLDYQGKSWSVDVPVSRAPLGRYTREVPAGLSQTIGEVTVTVERVFYTPAQTIVEYVLTRPPFHGSTIWNNNRWSPHVETADGRKLYGDGNSLGRYRDDGRQVERLGFPATAESATLVFPGLVRGEPASLEWPLAPGEQVQEHAGTAIRLSRWQRDGQRLAVELEFPAGAVTGLRSPVAVDAAGREFPTDGGEGASESEGRAWRQYQWELPAGADPVAIRIDGVGIMQEGPWRFPLPPG